MEQKTKKTYAFTNLKEIAFEDIIEAQGESGSGALLKAYALIPRDNADGMGGDGTAISGCDTTAMC